MVRQVDKGRLSKEVYILHENIIGDREILILTNKRLAYIQSNAVMGGWSCDWEYLYTDIQIPSIQLEGSRFFMIISPQVEDTHLLHLNPIHTVLLQQEERKSVLGGLFHKSSGKKVFLPEGTTKDSAHFIARIIQELQTCQDSFEPVFMKMILQKTK